jgi:undecaprenyl-diphosphatase
MEFPVACCLLALIAALSGSSRRRVIRKAQPFRAPPPLVTSARRGFQLASSVSQICELMLRRDALTAVENHHRFATSSARSPRKSTRRLTGQALCEWSSAVSLDQFDLPILRFLTSFTGKSEAFDHLIHAVSSYDVFEGVFMMSLLWFSWFRGRAEEIDDERKKRRARLLIVLTGSIVIVAFSRVLQLVLNIHQRPLLSDLGLTFPTFIDRSLLNPWNSFPSDHSMLFFAFATGLWRIKRSLGMIAYLWQGIVIDLPRVYLGIHYPSDVAAGAALGIICMLAFEKLPLERPALRLVASGDSHQASFYAFAFLLTDQLAHLFDDLRHIAAAALRIIHHR